MKKSFSNLVCTAVVGLSLFGVVACGSSSDDAKDSDEVLQDRIYADYNATLDASADKATFLAVFRDIAPSRGAIRLAGDNNIRVNEETLGVVEDDAICQADVCYQLVKPADDTLTNANHTFTFVDTDGKTYANSFQFMKPVKIDGNIIATPINLNGSEPFDVKWEAFEPSQDETITLRVTSAESAKEFPMTAEQARAGSMKISMADLNAIAGGRLDTGTLTIVRTKSENLTEAKLSGGKLNITTISDPINLAFVRL